MSSFHRRRLVAIVVVVMVADLVTKLAALRWLTDPVELPGLTLRVSRNPGVAFGLGADQPAAVVLAVTALVLVALGVSAWRGRLGGAIPASLVLGGGLANFADRAVGGGVVDLFDLGWWPVFNLADVFITVGVALLMVGSFGPEPDRHQVEIGAPPTESPVGSRKVR